MGGAIVRAADPPPPSKLTSNQGWQALATGAHPTNWGLAADQAVNLYQPCPQNRVLRDMQSSTLEGFTAEETSP
jgi:hypothetical protein